MLLRQRQFIQTVMFVLLAMTLALPAVLCAETETANTLLDDALQLYTAGDHTEALPQLLFLLESADEEMPMIEARLAVANIYLQNGQSDAALAQISLVPPTLRNDRTRLLEGQILLNTGLYDEGVATLKRVDEQNLPPTERAILLTDLARGSAGQGELFPALWFIHRALPLTETPEQESEAFALVMQLLNTDETTPQLPEIAFMFTGTPIGAAAAIRQVELALAAGDDDLARARIIQIDIGVIPGDFRKPAIALYTELTGIDWLQRSIGVVLPLSGKYAAYGDFVRRGMELALDGAANETGVRFLFADGAADATKSRAAVNSLLRDEKVVAVTGTITGSAAMAVAEQAQSEHVPLLTLSQRDGLPETGAYVFRNSLTARQQAEALARYAILDQGLTSFGVLYPENRLGQKMADLFTEEIEKLEGEVIALQSYDDTANDFGRQIKLLRGENPYAVEKDMTDEELLRDLFVPDTPPVDFEALFIPDYADRIAVIAPQLTYYGIENVPLLGINGWNSPELLSAVGNFVEGAVFVDGFFAYSPFPFVKEFVDRYYDKYGEVPTFLQAQGYDVAGMLLSILDNPEIRTRDDLRLALSQLPVFPGVTGATTFNLIGEADKALYLLQVRNGNIEQLNSLVDDETAEPAIIDDQFFND